MMAEAVAVLALGAEVIVGAILLAAGVLKIRAGEPAVVAAIRGYELLHGRVERWVARVLPWIEVALGLALVVGVTRGVAALGAGVLLSGFQLAMAYSLWSGRSHACGCGGGRRPTLVSWSLVARNAVLVGALALAELNVSASGALVALWCATAFVTAVLWIRARARAANALSSAVTASGA
jgi:uncharacterized membrane protein YphA (DoxX/SURF4 family)